MEQRSQNLRCSRKNSTNQHEASTREQINGNQEYRTKPKHRKSLDLGESRSSPPQVNIHTKYRRQGLKVQQLQQNIINLERELLMERKKNNRLKKIISSKIDKEKELESAYRDIVIQLKKQIKMNPLCFCKSKNTSDKLIDSKNESVGELKLEINILQDQKKQLQVDIQQLKQQLQQYLGNLKNQIKAKEEQYAKAIKLGLKNNQKLLMIKQSSFELKPEFSDKDRLSANHERFDSLQSRESFKSNQQLRKSHQFKQQCILSTQVPAKEEKQRHNPENPLFSRFMQQSPRCHQKEQKVERNHQHQKYGPNLNISFNTVHQLSQDSFESILSQAASQSWENNYCSKIIPDYKEEVRESEFKSIHYEPDFSDVSSVSILNKSHIKSLNNSEHELQNILRVSNSEQTKLAIEQLRKQIIKLQQLNSNLLEQNNRQSERDRQAVCRYVENIRIYINKFAAIINQYGSKHNMRLQAPQISSISFILSSKLPLSDILPDLNQFKNNSDLFLAHFVSNMSQLFVMQRKQLQKKLNNLNLQLYDSKNQIKFQAEQKESLSKRVDQLKSYINKLEYQLSQLSSIALESHALEQKPRSNLIRQLVKQRYGQKELKRCQSQVECQILSLVEFKKLQNFILNLPLLIKKYLSNLGIKGTQFPEIHMQGGLQAQLYQILDKLCATVDRNKSPLAQQQLLIRKYSLSLRDIGQFPKKSQKPEVDLQTFYLMQAELKLLQTKLAQKQKMVQRLKQKFLGEKRETIKKQEELKKNTNNQPKIMEQVSIKDYFTNLQGTFTKAQKETTPLKQTGQFREYSEIKQFNNLSLGKDQLVKELREKVELLQKEIGRYRSQCHKKKRIHFLNH